MADVSYLLNNVPNKVVSTNYLMVNPTLASRFYLLGLLPNSQAFLLPKYTTKDQNNLTATATPVVAIIPSMAAPSTTGLSSPVVNTSTTIGSSQASIQPALLIYNTDTSTILQYISGSTWVSLAESGSGGGGGGITFNLITITSSYTILSTDFTICANCSTGPISVVCPVSGLSVGQYFIIKRLDSSVHELTVDGGGNLIDGLPTMLISNQWDDISIQWTGTGWIEI